MKSNTPRPSPWWHPERFAARRPFLETRGRIKHAVRGALRARGFTEVETPILQRSPGNETHISAFKTEAIGTDGNVTTLYLHSSPEFTCKKLLAAGVEQPYTLAPVFRNRERGRLHHPEFLMLEWYRAGGTLDQLMADCVALLRESAKAAGTTMMRHRGAISDPFVDPEILPVTDAFFLHAGLDLPAMLPTEPDGFARLQAATEALGLRVADDDTWSDLFSKILSAVIEPRLGLGRPTFLTRYPASEAALARLCPDDPRFAERFELYVCQIELANAFGELRDVGEQRRRFEAAETERQRIYGDAYPIDEDFLDALTLVPEACGIALGFDRLVMLATNADTIDDVLWAPVTDTLS